ncbi:hypothetical protein DFA_11412 [Cavenderia fasciculata]|uniref:Uncharacterized protein n=1 Tax=Cavenderia fasciculata TaxID=261658 RepID=F4QCR9_CACFS|nr:uncharacterized protein DFA_11412 [Cavenderia fasciculata]EGG13651.1 hypothetical protein DFA_11412 [Cavenderia fasciculata]|eukprot:XP_004350355.1 hypothetical protein DFA_11412 [Cavenderia fasciculata]
MASDTTDGKIESNIIDMLLISVNGIDKSRCDSVSHATPFSPLFSPCTRSTVPRRCEFFPPSLPSNAMIRFCISSTEFLNCIIFGSIVLLDEDDPNFFRRN